ncbi:MAG: HAD family hydrolase [Desulfatitalea sp.]|nr:HAD family hydrolase [Desulfatitalea sp.]MBI5897014.1 HAD family hydrolase [Desulfobacterales bacterium]
MIENHIKVVAFDCDGVLFDSSLSNRAYYNQILQHLGRPPMTDEQFAYVHMHTVDEALVYLFDDPDSLAAVQRYRRTMSYLPFIRDMIVEPNLRELLVRLRPAYKTAIATNRTDTMTRVLQAHDLQDFFDKVVTASDVRQPKPYPDQLLLLLTHFGIEPHQMLYVGDSELDAAASHQAGVPFIAYDNPRLTAKAHIQNLKQILSVLGH